MGMNYRSALMRKTGLKMSTDPVENRFSADPGVLDLFPGMRLVVAVAFGLDNATANPGVDADWIRSVETLLELWM